MRAAHMRQHEHGQGVGAVKPGELVQAAFADGASPSTAARKAFVMLLAKAAGDAWQDRWFAIGKADLRGSHQSTDRLQDVMDELLRTLLRVQVKSEDGGPDDVLTGAIVSDCKMATTEDARSMVRWRFSEAMREVLRRSDHYAELRTQIVAALESRYSVTLYEIGCMFHRRQHQVWTVSQADFRERLGVPASYRDWTDIERRTLKPAKAELDHVAPFTVDWRVTQRRGRAVETLAISFTPKDPTSRQAAEAELQRSRVGRKARRSGAVETVTVAPHLPGFDDESSS